MKNKIKLTINTILLITLIFFLNGCGKTKNLPQNTNSKTIQNGLSKGNSEPSWLENPQKDSNGKRASTGCASRHIDGVTAQKKLALQRAIDEIAMQKSTKVQTISYSTKTYDGGEISSKNQSSSLHETQNIDVNTKVLEYFERDDGGICVWIIEE